MSQDKKFVIKYHEKITQSITKSPQQETIKTKTKPEVVSLRKQLKLESQPREINKSIDVAEMTSDRYNRKAHILSEDSEQLPIKKRQKCANSVSFKERATLNSAAQIKKDYQRVPIEWSDETNLVGLNGKIVYKSYCPKNSYNLMNNLKQIDENTDLEMPVRNNYQTDLQFNSRFQSGNLATVLRISKKEYWLYMKEDTNTHGLRQWFFFQAICNRPIKVTFRIYRFSKKFSLYRKGMKPYIKQNFSQWSQKGQQVRYQYDKQQNCYYLQFVYEFQRDRQRILVAAMPPYTYSRLTRYIGKISNERCIKIDNIGFSLGGVQIPVIQIGSGCQQPQNGGTGGVRKRAIIILGRIHPAETCSNYSLESIIQNIVANADLRSRFDFYIVPMVNPDGVMVGNHRTSLVGIDLNRKYDFNFANRELFPEVDAVKNYVKNIHLKQTIQFLIDLHGHSAKPNIFAYGQQELIRTEKHLKSRIIPKLLSESLDSFKYGSCVFQSYRQKKNTARVYFSKKYYFSTLTFEQSYGLVDKELIGIGDWRLFGEVLIQVINKYMRNCMDKTQIMAQILRQQIKIQQVQLQLLKQQKMRRLALQQSKKVIVKETKTQPNILQKIKQQDEPQANEDDLQLDSGDQQLQNGQIELQLLRKKLFVRSNPPPQSHRQSFVIPDMTIELQQVTSRKVEIVHEQKMPIISRIMRMKEKKKASTDLINLLTQRSGRDSKDVKQKIKEFQIKLPNIAKYIS